jgi:hypothetical protein
MSKSKSCYDRSSFRNVVILSSNSLESARRTKFENPWILHFIFPHPTNGSKHVILPRRSVVSWMAFVAVTPLKIICFARNFRGQVSGHLGCDNCVFLGVKWPEREAQYSPPSSAESPSLFRTLWLAIKDNDNFAYTFSFNLYNCNCDYL